MTGAAEILIHLVTLLTLLWATFRRGGELHGSVTGFTRTRPRRRGPCPHLPRELGRHALWGRAAGPPRPWRGKRSSGADLIRLGSGGSAEHTVLHAP
jgi:hypothetical protein